MDTQATPHGPKISRFIDHYADAPATPPAIDEAVVENPSPRQLDALKSRQPAEPQVVSNQPTRSNPSPAMQRTFDLQEEINRRRSVTGK